MKSTQAGKKSIVKAQEEVAAAESVLDKAVKSVEKKAGKKVTKKEEKIDSADEKVKVKSSEKAKSKSSEKNTDKKASAKKSMDAKVVFQFYGNEIETKALIEQAKADFIAAGGKEKEIKAMELYIKPEENAAYYVINGVPSGKIAIFA